jgi:geranylgeranyl diphosphate synthase type II
VQKTSEDMLSREIEQAINRLEIPERPKSLYDPVRYTLRLGGKRIRPRLVLIGCGLAGGDINEALPAAMAVELLHNFTLIHDDIMDGATSRRGQPAVHTRWDESTAILSGDVMFNLAYEQLQKFSEAALFAQLHPVFSEATRIVCEGQALDMEFESSLSVEIEDYIHMIECKTAALIRASLQMGALAGKAGDTFVSQLGTLGLAAGTAFQIQDDLLDAIADPETFGKRPGGDIYEGKKTYLSILALQRAEGGLHEKLSGILQKTDATQDEVDEVIAAYHELSVIEDTRAAIYKRYQSCHEVLDLLPESSFKTALLELIEMLKERRH